MIPPLRPSSRAFSLVEVTLALGIAAFCLLAIFGLLPVGVTNNQVSITQTAAASAAASVVADLQAAPRVPTGVSPASLPAATPSSPSFAVPVQVPGGPQPTFPPASANPNPATIYLREDGSIAAAPGALWVNVFDATRNPYFRATVFIYPPGQYQRNATTARVLVTWPAISDPDPSKPPANYTGSFETVAALNRN